MGKRGTKPTPTKVLAMRGSWRAKTRPQEPDPPPLQPEAPAWLDDAGKQLWATWHQRLTACGILTEVDEVTFGRYCQTLAHWLKLTEFVQKHGEVYPVKSLTTGQITSFAIFPQVGLYLRLSEQLLRMEAAFGLTPASRATVQKQDTPAHGNSGPKTKDKARFFQAV